MTPAGAIDLGIRGLTDAVDIGHGHGGFADVYRAFQSDLDRYIAVKVFRGLATDRKASAVFARECRAIGRIAGRSNILTVYDTGTTAHNKLYLTMAYMKEGSLGERLDRERSLPWREAVDIGIKLAKALQIAHDAKVLHLDVKPDNILISDDGEPLLADFGTARLTDVTRKTKAQTAITPDHVAPEVWAGETPTASADIYSLASTVYALIVGRPAFVESGDDYYAIHHRVDEHKIPDLMHRMDVPTGVCHTIERALEKNPANRPTSALLFGKELDAAQTAIRHQSEVTLRSSRPVRVGAVKLHRVSRANPACIIILVDCSNSMNQRLGRSRFPRRVVVAHQINSLLDALITQATKELGTLAYFWVAVQGYGLGDGCEVGSLLPDIGLAHNLLPIDQVAATVQRWNTVQERVPLPDGSTIIENVEYPVWIEPTAELKGQTVACAAFRRALNFSVRWVAERPTAFPPLVLNITDGGYTDGDPRDLVRAIEALETNAGQGLVFNCHLSGARLQQPLIFPTDDEAAMFKDEARLLFDQSSRLPGGMVEVARKRGHAVRDGARGYIFNADLTDLATFFEVGTIGRVEYK